MAVRLAKRRWIITVALAAGAAGGLFVVARMGQSVDVDARLQAIDAAHGMDEGENPAGGYTELAWDWRLPPLDQSSLPAFGAGATALEKPWRSADFPRLAAWIKQRQAIIDELLRLSRYEKCWFSVFEARWQASRRHYRAREWGPLLVRAANLDLGEGRTDVGLEKILCVLRAAAHFRAQLSPSDRWAGERTTSHGLARLARLLVSEDVPEAWLARIEAALPETRNTWEQESPDADEVRWLYERERRLPIVYRLKRIRFLRKQARIRKDSYLQNLAQCRAVHLMLALRRHKNRTGVWPADLAELESNLTPEVFIDPLTGKGFGYRCSGETFTLYTLAPSGTDDGDKLGSNWVFWPR